MAVFGLVIALLNLCVVAHGQTTSTPSFSLGSLLRIPRHCIINLLSCKENCSECGACYEKFLDCVIDFKAEETSSDTSADDPDFGDIEGSLDDDATETEIEIPGTCVDKYQECIKGNCTECSLCYNIAIDCVDRNSLVEDSNDPDDPDYFDGPMFDEPQYPGYLGYPGSPFPYGDYMGYSQYPGSEGGWYPTQADQRSTFPSLGQLANYFSGRQFQFFPSNIGFPIPQFETTTTTTTPPTDSVDPTTEGQVEPTTEAPVLYEECLRKFTKCLVNCAECTVCLPEFQKCSVSAYRPRIKGSL
ncbi:uncharacterized protein [Palaemon carinicauda]|uniref:uncharacterized protein n=1 Tax=Palaemon carinicauda TaxID=392227 RepID=UPI0035B5E2D2